MFTGLIAEIGEVQSVDKNESGARLVVYADKVASDASTGDSISVNGACLTVVDRKANLLAFDLSTETLRSTTLGMLKNKDKVNIEPSLSPGSKLGGHFVTGHVDGIGRITSRSSLGTSLKFMINTGKKTAGFLVEKGSVAVDGISLTVVDVLVDGFSVVIIPHTARMTTIGLKNAGDSVNIEVDILGKYVSKFLNRDGGDRFMATLSEEGFV